MVTENRSLITTMSTYLKKFRIIITAINYVHLAKYLIRTNEFNITNQSINPILLIHCCTVIINTIIYIMK